MKALIKRVRRLRPQIDRMGTIFDELVLGDPKWRDRLPALEKYLKEGMWAPPELERLVLAPGEATRLRDLRIREFQKRELGDPTTHELFLKYLDKMRSFDALIGPFSWESLPFREDQIGMLRNVVVKYHNSEGEVYKVHSMVLGCFENHGQTVLGFRGRYKVGGDQGGQHQPVLRTSSHTHSPHFPL